MSRPRYRDEPGLASEVDPEVIVAWYCPYNLCEQSDGFWIESQ